MPGFLLDTDTVIYGLRGDGRVGERIVEHRPSQLAVSAITLAELIHGTERKKSRRLRELIAIFLERITVAPFDSHAADRYGKLAASLAERGTPIGVHDTLIGAHALALGYTLVTNNTKHFQRIPGLKTESWV